MSAERAAQGVHLLTPRLALRPLDEGDRDDALALCSDERVMQPLGGALAPEEGARWFDRQVAHWHAHGFGRFRVSQAGAFVGMVGLLRSDFDAGIVPGVEVAWRLAYGAWGHGYATEAARAVVEDGFARLGLDAIVAVTTPENARSRRVMDRLGMRESPGEAFEHPRLPAGHPLRRHVVYRVTRREWNGA